MSRYLSIYTIQFQRVAKFVPAIFLTAMFATVTSCQEDKGLSRTAEQVTIDETVKSVDDLELLTENHAPLNYRKDGVLLGISVDTMVEMLALAGSTKSRRDIHLQPWKRAYETALDKKNTALFAMTRNESRENLFKWVGPILPSNIVVIAKKSKGIRIDSVEDLNGFTKIGAVREDIGEQLLLEKGVRKENIYQTNSGMNTAKMLHSDRIQLWAYGRIIAFWYLRELGYDTADYEVVHVLHESSQYYAFNKAVPDEVIAQLQAALDTLKKNGTLDKIIRSYL